MHVRAVIHPFLVFENECANEHPFRDREESCQSRLSRFSNAPSKGTEGTGTNRSPLTTEAPKSYDNGKSYDVVRNDFNAEIC